MARERPLLQAMAAYKYDGYQQFSPGMRFIESLTRWLSQFEKMEDRQTAYQFAKRDLIYCSSDEMSHLVEMAYPDHIRPLLVRKVAAELGVNPRHVATVTQSPIFRIRQRQCLFLGLSDGARIADFRRSNRDLNNEQIWQTHEISEARAMELLDKLATHLGQLVGSEAPANPRFRTVVLLDDFSASGTSYYRPKKDGTAGGKIATFHKAVSDPKATLSQIVEGPIDVIVLLYVVTEAAKKYLNDQLSKLSDPGKITYRVEAVQEIGEDVRSLRGTLTPLGSLIENHYDHEVFDEHFEKGGTSDAKYGYADGGLPVVLHHNTPNNSVALLWSYDNMEMVGLFPRVQRHKESP